MHIFGYANSPKAQLTPGMLIEGSKAESYYEALPQAPPCGMRTQITRNLLLFKSRNIHNNELLMF